LSGKGIGVANASIRRIFESGEVANINTCHGGRGRGRGNASSVPIGFTSVSIMADFDNGPTASGRPVINGAGQGRRNGTVQRSSSQYGRGHGRGCGRGRGRGPIARPHMPVPVNRMQNTQRPVNVPWVHSNLGRGGRGGGM
jgi:hypothetical protein